MNLKKKKDNNLKASKQNISGSYFRLFRSSREHITMAGCCVNNLIYSKRLMCSQLGLGIVRNFPVPVPIPVPPNDSGSGSGSHSIKNISKRKIHNPFCVYFL